MTVAEITEKMIAFSKSDMNDINHMLKVYSYARTIAALEGVDEETMKIIEISAVVHDISCPICREKYGSTAGKYQEAESPAVLEEFFSGSDIDGKILQRVCGIVSRHHTYENIDGTDCRILMEADLLVNFDEMDMPAEEIKAYAGKVFATNSGKILLRSIYGI